MFLKRALLTLGCISLVFGLAWAQEKPAAAGAASAEEELLWMWGEVVSVDAPANKLTIKHLDYETDTEKETPVIIDEKTTYENVPSLSQINPKDSVSIDYVASAEQNLARTISVEKPEETKLQEEIGNMSNMSPMNNTNSSAMPSEADVKSIPGY